MLREYNFIIWNDASVRYNGKQYGLEKVFKDTRKHGLQIMGGGKSSITSRTSKNTFEVLKEDPCKWLNLNVLTSHLQYLCIASNWNLVKPKS
jgi:hypothetical protein